MIQPADNSFFKGLALTISPCTKWPPKIPRAQRPRARFPPHAPRLVIFNCSAKLPAMSIDAVPTNPPTIDQNRNSMRLPLGPTFPGWVCSFGAKVRPCLVICYIDSRLMVSNCSLPISPSALHDAVDFVAFAKLVDDIVRRVMLSWHDSTRFGGTGPPASGAVPAEI